MIRINVPTILRAIAWSGALLACVSVPLANAWLLAIGSWLCGFGSGAGLVLLVWTAMREKAQEGTE